MNSSSAPYEKNLEVWRQLWRVVFRCVDFERYVRAVSPLSFFSARPQPSNEFLHDEDQQDAALYNGPNFDDECHDGECMGYGKKKNAQKKREEEREREWAGR